MCMHVCVRCTLRGTTTGAKVKPQVSLLNIHIIVLFYLSLMVVSLSEEKTLFNKKIFVDAAPRASVSSICRVTEPMLLYSRVCEMPKENEISQSNLVSHVFSSVRSVYSQYHHTASALYVGQLCPSF